MRDTVTTSVASAPTGFAGTVTDSQGHRLAGICVTASSRAASGGRTVLSSAGGLFAITGLRAGSYLLRYRACLTGVGRAGDPAVAALGSGPLVTPVAVARGYVTSGHLSQLGLVALRSRSAVQAAARPARPASPAVRWITAAQLRRSGSQQNGGIAGRVVGPNGRPVKGLCAFASVRGGAFGVGIGANGRYNFGKSLPPHTYQVSFSAVCAQSDSASANWATEWYKDHLHLSQANPVTVKAGVIIHGIGGVMQRGGVISGTVTGHTGHGLAGVCVVLASAKGEFVQQVISPRDGRYRFQGLDPGRYGVGFFPECGRGLAGYLMQWWPGTAKLTKHGLIQTGIGTVTTHIDAQLVLGGTISGTVRLRNQHGQPLKGICVDATPSGQPDSEIDFSGATNAEGRYSLKGLTAGRYAVSFSPGCNNNGNYLGQNYPHSVTVRLSQVKGGINAYLRPGGIITGTVTAKAGGARLAGICVSADDSIAETGPDGTYAVDQLSPGKVQLQFSNCSNKGSFAPQFYPNQLDGAKAVSIKIGPGQVVKGINAAMAPGGTISGTITLPSGDQPGGVCVQASGGSEEQENDGFATTHHGSYVVKNLAPDTYDLEYLSCGERNISDAWFSSPGHVTLDENLADQFQIPLGGTVSGIDATVGLGGSISGSVFAPAKDEGAFVCENVSRAGTGVSTGDVLFGVPAGSGFVIFGFAPGRYLVEFEPCGDGDLAPQWYDRATRPAQATLVLVRPGHTTQKVDAHLIVGGSISGQVVSKRTGRPVTDVCVNADGIDSPTFGFGVTDKSGKYLVTGLNTGRYRLFFTSCSGAGLVPVRSGVVQATAGKAVTAPKTSVAAVRDAAISGQVSTAGPGRPVPVVNACVDAVPVNGGGLGLFETGEGFTGRRGHYQITGLLPGKYKVLLGDEFCETDPAGLVPQWFPGTPLISKATEVTVSAGRTRSISAVLPHDGSISGTVTGPAPARTPLGGVCVQVTPAAHGAAPFLAESSASGGYHTGPLLPGRYLVEFESGCGATGFASQWWHGAASAKTATFVTVRAGRTEVGISASMKRAGG